MANTQYASPDHVQWYHYAMADVQTNDEHDFIKVKKEFGPVYAFLKPNSNRQVSEYSAFAELVKHDTLSSIAGYSKMIELVPEVDENGLLQFHFTPPPVRHVGTYRFKVSFTWTGSPHGILQCGVFAICCTEPFHVFA